MSYVLDLASVVNYDHKCDATIWSINPTALDLSFTIVICLQYRPRENFIIHITSLSSKHKLEILKGGSITVPLTSCLTGLELYVRQQTIFVFICKTDQSKPVKQEVNGTLILPP